MERRSINLRESKAKNEYMDMAFDEIEKLDKDLKKFAKSNGFDASFEYDDDATYLTIIPTDKTAQITQFTLPQAAIQFIGSVCNSTKSDLVIQTSEGDKGFELWFASSPHCVNSEDSYSNICDYCDHIRSFIK